MAANSQLIMQRVTLGTQRLPQCRNLNRYSGLAAKPGDAKLIALVNSVHPANALFANGFGARFGWQVY